MIYIFRKEMKKWQNILWVVFVSLAAGGLGMIFTSPRNAGDTKMAKVNGTPVYFDQYRRALADIQERVERIRAFARAYGMSEEQFLKAYMGVDNPEQLALDNCIQDTLYDQVKDSLSVCLDQAWFKQELIKSMPQVVDEQGNVNMEAYHAYLQRLAIKPADYETKRADEMKRDVVKRCVQHLAYVPNFILRDAFARDHVKRSFSYFVCSSSHFTAEAQKSGSDDKEVEAYYLTNKESYRTEEKRSAMYWQLDTKSYVASVDLDEATIRNFYEKNKGTLYRIAPKVKVRRILVKGHSAKTRASIDEALAKVQAEPSSFAAVAQKVSQDTATAAHGGMVDFFTKGTHDAEFEKTAFRLQKVGEISAVTRTKDGYEIVQLVERVSASEKSFDVVRDDIVTSLRAKRAMGTLRSDLETLVRATREDKQAIAAFAEQHKLNKHETGWLTDATTKGTDTVSAIARKLFSNQKRSSGVGYFVHEDQYIIYQVTGTEKSSIPPFNTIKETVRADYIHDQAGTLAQRELKDLRTAILAGKLSLADAAAQLGSKVVSTGMATTSADLKDLGSDAPIRNSLFSLTEPGEVLFITSENNFYLAEIKESTELDNAVFAAKRAEINKNEMSKAGTVQTSAFIASLYRNATLEIDKKALVAQTNAHSKDE